MCSPEKSVIAPIKPPDEVVLMNSNTVIEQLDRILRSKKVMPLCPTTCLPVDKEYVFAREFFFVDGFHSQVAILSILGPKKFFNSYFNVFQYFNFQYVIVILALL